MKIDTTRVLLADDNLLFRDGLRAMLLSTPDIEVVGEAADGEEAVTFAARLMPDVILMDLNMPKLNGIEAARSILYNNPHVNILVISMFEDSDSVSAALAAGARGYLLKGTLRAETVQAIRDAVGRDRLHPAVESV